MNLTEQQILLILGAAAVAIFGYGLTHILVGLVRPDGSKLQERLRAEVNRELADTSREARIERQQEALPAFLAGSRVARKFALVLRQAFPRSTLRGFLSLWFMTILACGTAGFMFYGALGSVLAGAVGLVVPLLVVIARRNRRQRILADQLMDALDFLARVLRAGHSLATGFQMIGQELPDPIAAEFQRCYDQNSLGQSIDQAMLDMAARIDSTDFAFFVTSVIIQRQTGGDLAALLDGIADVIRKRIRLQQHTKALTAEGRFSGWILSALPPGLFLLLFFLNPDYVGTLVNTTQGRYLLIVAVVLMIIGQLLIKKIVTIKV